MGVQAFGFEKNLVGILIGEAVDLVLDRRAVTRTHTFDHPGVHRRAIQPAADDLVSVCIGVGDPAGYLRWMLVRRAKIGKHRTRLITGLLGQPGKVDAAPVQTRRRAGFQPADTQRQFAQPRRQGIGRGIAGAATLVIRQTDMNPSGQERAGGEHNRTGTEPDAGLGDDAGDARAVEDQIRGGLLKDLQMRLILDEGAHRSPVQRAIRLAAGSAHRRPLAAVENAELDAGTVGSLRHDAAEGIDFLDQMALAYAADGRVAAHCAHGFEGMRQQQSAQAHARRRQTGFGAGMAAANHDDIKGFGIVHGRDTTGNRSRAAHHSGNGNCTA